MKKIALCIMTILLITIALTGGCIGDEDTIVDKTGTVQYIDLEGGFYGIVDDDGNKYDPVNLPDEYKEDGLRVKFSGCILKDQVSIHMWGTLIELTDIQEV